MIQIRQIGEMSFHKNRIHAVDAKHDHPLPRGPRGVIGASRSQQERHRETGYHRLHAATS
jgi:hypothetical protein